MGRAEQVSAVQHKHQTVRRQFVDLILPSEPRDDEEAFIVRDQTGRVLLTVRPRDFQQTIACLRQAASDAGMVA